MKKPPKRLFKERDVIHSYQHERSTKSQMKDLEHGHLNIPEMIEFVLVNAARQDPSIDDRMIDQALRDRIQGSEPAEDAYPGVVLLNEVLTSTRAMCGDATSGEVPDNIWIASLRQVDESVPLHSSLKAGERSYLQFLEETVRS
jgi:hypothetical protein